jgi:hypothetical protein
VTGEGVLLLVTVDGRQKTLSRGATLAELAALLLRLGARDAVNLDGGGSTALAVRDALVNAPSEGKERPVANALLVFAPHRRTPGAISPPVPGRLTGPPSPLTVGRTWRFAPAEPGTAAGALLWGATGGVGFIAQDGRFRALRPGVGTVRAWDGAWFRESPVTVNPPAKPVPEAGAAPDAFGRPR